MFAVAACLVGIFILLVVSEALSRNKVINAEHSRKLLHITAGVFIASWPWIISWHSIQLLSVLMLFVVVVNNNQTYFKFTKDIGRKTHGDIFFAVAIILCSLLTTNKVFFALAILHLALADGLAAIVGKSYGMKWKYSVLGHTKTILGSMTFWLISLCLLGVGLLFANEAISFENYAVLLLLLPPVLTAIENATPQGLDNILVPVTVILALNLAQSM